MELRQHSLPKVQFVTKALPKDFATCSEQGEMYLLVKSALAVALKWRYSKILAPVEQNG